MSKTVPLVNKYYTYQLSHPLTDEVFYVGKGCGNRMYKHEKDVRLGKVPNKTNYKLFNKIYDLVKKGLSPKYEKLIENVVEIEALSLESAFIDFYGMENLCNYLKSWSGVSERRLETRIKQSLANRGEKSYMYGKPKTKKQKEKNRIAHTGINNARYIKTKYAFYNESMGIVETLTPYDFRKKYKVDSGGLNLFLNGKRLSIKGWTLGKVSLEEIENERREKIRQKTKGVAKSESHRKNLWKNRKRRSI